MQLLESPIPPLTAAALRIIICKRPAPHFDNHEKGMKNAFLRPFTMTLNVYQRIKKVKKKGIEIFTFA